MARVSVMNLAKARRSEGGSLEFFGEGHPIHLHVHSLAWAGELPIASAPVDRTIYVWSGEVTVGECVLPQGSAIVVERGAEASVRGIAVESQLLLFAGASPSSHARAGGHVHLLPRDRVPMVAQMGASGVGGSIFANGQCPSCEVWLHENRFPALSAPPADPQAGVHSHDEDEIIFVTGGQMQLGRQLVGPGTAIAIAAGTLYSFLPGPDGLTFVNFRAGLPGQIHFANGHSADEVAVWSGTDRPLEYLNA